MLRLAAAFPVPRQMSLVQFGFTTTTRLLQLAHNKSSLSLSPLNSLSGTDKGAQCRARQRRQRATLDDATKRQHWIDFYPRPEGQPDQFVSSALGCCVCRFSVFLPVCLSLHCLYFRHLFPRPHVHCIVTTDRAPHNGGGSARRHKLRSVGVSTYPSPVCGHTLVITSRPRLEW